MMIFLVPTPPSVNAMYANVPRVGRVKTKRYRMWQREALKAFRSAGKTIHHPVMVSIEVWKNGLVVEDLDNRIKPCLDLLVVGAIIADDRQVVEVRAAWTCDGSRRKTTIEVTDRNTPEDWRRLGKRMADE